MVAPQVDTELGRIIGIERDGVSLFKGIPYAKGPEGDSRFRPPLPHDGFSGSFDATKYGPMARQNVWALEKMIGADNFPQSEDCLTLNIWTPSTEGSLPVMFWIHGGAFLTGSGAVPWYNGERLAKLRDVVVVTINYRLGVFGFGYLGEIGGEEFASSGICGLLDQVAALEWVRKHIAAFGGDPQQVTVFGESAGAMSIGALLGLPQAKGLFKRAILQSGACANLSFRDVASETTEKLIDALGYRPDQIERLLEAPAEDLLRAQEEIDEIDGTRLTFQPVVDRVNFTDHPFCSVQEGSSARVDLIVGTNLEEMKLFGLADPELMSIDEARMLAMARKFVGERGPEIVAEYRRMLGSVSLAEVWQAIITDYVFRIPAIRLAEAQAEHANVYSYLFSWKSPAFGGLLGSCHVMEIPFAFDNIARAGAEMFLGSGDDRQPLASSMSGSWAKFASTGVPSEASLPEWPAYNQDDRQTMIFDTECRVESDPYGDMRKVWEGITPGLV